MVSAALAVGLGIGVADTASAATITPPSGYQEIVSTNLTGSGGARECLDETDGSLEPGAVIQDFHCHGFASNGAPQLWDFLLTRFGDYEILNKNSDMCLTANPGGAIGQDPTRQEPCGPPGSGQEWSLLDEGSLGFQLVNVDSGGTLCLSVRPSGVQGDHAQTTLLVCSTNAKNQLWQF